MHDANSSTANGKRVQGIANLAIKRIVDIIITGPVLEQITENVERICPGRNLLNKMQKRPRAMRLFHTKV